MRQGIVRRVADLALQIEPDRHVVLQWILHTPLPALGGQTTFELACEGQGERVITLLNHVLLQPGNTPPRLPQARAMH
ncbi:hypothetical protein [Stenotrophomonas rhizophila]|uniref:hypothetical protein n=1 Tax=Stenotrophomonas rhizophila TaxID=216778 RepID=UPI001E2D6E59|nr:hypothetical protein [Stenotrophomonas rhizophila]MCC7632920.1 hypothetical protein [Stenotrophomonas rhizophila]MCC7662355.1 hypothetical protein [Stenotrophomonas rhizophila]